MMNTSIWFGLGRIARSGCRLKIAGGDIMPLARGFRTTLLERAQRDAEFRQAMLKEGIDTKLAGDVATGKSDLA